MGFCCTLNGWMIGSAKDEHQIWDSSAILSSYILFVYTCGIYIYIVCMPTLYIYIQCIQYFILYIPIIHMCFILLQTHDLESLPGEKLAQW